MNQPFFSIIVPVYNVEKYLRQCIDSIINQSFQDYELILINDGSTDDSLEICNEYSKKQPNLVVVNQNNQGVSIARNYGLSIANGKYIWFVDADDYVADTSLSIFYEYLLVNEISILGFNNYHIKDDTVKPNFINPTISVLSVEEFIEKGYVIECAPWISVFKRTFLIENKLRFNVSLLIYEDNYFINDCIEKAESIAFIQDYLYYYRILDNSLSAKSKDINIRFNGLLSLLFQVNDFSRKKRIGKYWQNQLYVLLNSVHKIYITEFDKLTIENKKYYLLSKGIKTKIFASDILGIKLMKFLHNNYFSLYKYKLLQ